MSFNFNKRRKRAGEQPPEPSNVLVECPVCQARTPKLFTPRVRDVISHSCPVCGSVSKGFYYHSESDLVLHWTSVETVEK